MTPSPFSDIVFMQHSSQPRSTPIHSLPVELIQEIFLCSTALKFERLTDKSLVPPRFSFTALALSHVCTYWHAIALAFPELWASIAVCCPTDHIVDLTYLYIERSGDLTSLDLAMIDVTSKGELYAEGLVAHNTWTRSSYEILDLWISQAHRWIGVNFTLSYIEPLEWLLKIPNSSLQNLQRASLDLKYTGLKTEEFHQLWDKIHTSEHLREVHWPYDYWGHPPLASFEHLIDIYLPSITLEGLATLASRAQLVKFSVRNLEISPATGVLQLPALEYLAVGRLQEESSWLLERIFTPRLRHLAIRQGVELVDVSALHRFLSRTKCILNHLDIMLFRTSETNAVHYLQLAIPLLSYLRRLAFNVNWITEATVDALMPRVDAGSTRVPFPLLEELSLLGCRSEDGRIGGLVSSLVSAQKPLARFRVVFYNENHNHTLDKAILDGLKQTGALKVLDYTM